MLEDTFLLLVMGGNCHTCFFVKIRRRHSIFILYFLSFFLIYVWLLFEKYINCCWHICLIIYIICSGIKRLSRMYLMWLADHNFRWENNIFFFFILSVVKNQAKKFNPIRMCLYLYIILLLFVFKSKRKRYEWWYMTFLFLFLTLFW